MCLVSAYHISNIFLVRFSPLYLTTLLYTISAMESSSSPPSSPVRSLSPEVAAYFEEQGLVSSVAGNKRTLSAALLPISPSSTASSSGLVDSITSASFSTTYVTKQVDSFSIPDRLESQETLEYLGFLPDTAAEIRARRVMRQQAAIRARRTIGL